MEALKEGRDMVYIEDIERDYPIHKNPNLSRASQYGVLAESVIEEVCRKGKSKSKVIEKGPYSFGGFRTLDYFPKYDVYLYTSSHAPWSFGNTFYAKSEKAYRKFWKEVVSPVTKELWKY